MPEEEETPTRSRPAARRGRDEEEDEKPSKTSRRSARDEDEEDEKPARGRNGSHRSSGRDRDEEEKQHEVRITKAFYMGVYEVTQGQFKRVMGYNPSYHSKDGTRRTIDT